MYSDASSVKLDSEGYIRNIYIVLNIKMLYFKL